MHEINQSYNTKSQIKFKALMLKPSSCDYSDAYTRVKGTIFRRVAQWLPTCAWRPKVPGQSPVANYVQR